MFLLFHHTFCEGRLINLEDSYNIPVTLERATSVISSSPRFFTSKCCFRLSKNWSLIMSSSTDIMVHDLHELRASAITRVGVYYEKTQFIFALLHVDVLDYPRY